MKTRIERPRTHRSSGFTLLEMVIVLGIIAMIMGSAIFALKGFKDKAKQPIAKGDINTYLAALEMYRINKGRYPTTQEGLQVLANDKTMKRLVQDPWGRDYVYRFPGKINNAEPEIIYLGEDGKEGTEDDINSQNM